MSDTDRKKIKDQQKGIYLTAAGISDSKGEVEKLHEETFTFDVSSDASVSEIGLVLKKKALFKHAEFTPSTALAASGAAYITQLLQKRDGEGGGAVTVASLDTNTAGQNVSLSAFEPASFTASSTAANLLFAAGNVLTFKSTETSTPATPIGKVTVTVEYV